MSARHLLLISNSRLPSTYMGETQEERILQLQEENDAPVAGLREGAHLEIADGAVTLHGVRGARIFRRGRAPVEALPVRRVEECLELR